MTTAKDMLEMLRAHYRGTPSKPMPGYLADEIQAPNSARRADALWLPLDGYRRGQIIGHEIKVARSDVMAELADPMKAEAWGQYCDAWWLVVPDVALLRDLDIPDGWGIMTPPSAKSRSKRLMTVVRAAPARKPNRDREPYATILSRIYFNGDDQGSLLRHATSRYQRAEDLLAIERTRAQEAEQRLREAGMSQSPHAQALETRVRRVLDLIVSRWNLPNQAELTYQAIRALAETTDEEVVAAIVDLARARGAAKELAREVEVRLHAFETALRQPDLATIIAALESLKAVADE